MSFKDDLPRYNDPLPYKADTFLFTKRKPLESSARLIGGTKALVKALVDFSSIESDQRHQIIYTTPWGETSNHCWCSMGRKISINGFLARWRNLGTSTSKAWSRKLSLSKAVTTLAQFGTWCLTTGLLMSSKAGCKPQK